MKDEDDWALVARAQAGDVPAFATLVRRYQSPLIHFISRMTGSRHEAEDLAQESFIRLHRYLNRLTPEAKFSTVLFGMARDLTLNWLRNMNRRGLGKHVPLDGNPIPYHGQASDERVRQREIASALERGIAELNIEHREVILLREVEGLDYESIAEITGTRVGTVKSRLARAREQLRLRLVQNGVELR